MYEELYTLERYKTDLLPTLEPNEVQCDICGKQMRRMTHSHLVTHSEFLNNHRGTKWVKVPEEILDEIRQEDPDTPKFSKRDETFIETYERLFGGLSRINAVTNKLLALYHPSYVRWVLMDPPFPDHARFAHWMYVTANNPAFKMSRITQQVIKIHLRGQGTIGVFPRFERKTRFLVWDLDYYAVDEEPFWQPEIEAKKAAVKLVLLLRKYGFTPHVVASGEKGYHVVLYFQREITYTMAEHLFQHCLDHPEGPDVSNIGSKIECLPIANAAKMPLGINFKSGKFAGFVDPLTLTPMKDPYGYLLTIRPDAVDLLDHIQKDGEIAKPRSRRRTIGDRWSEEATQTAYKIGIKEPGMRHKMLLKAAAFIRNSPQLCPETFEEFYKTLILWSRKQYDENRNNIRTPFGEHVRDVERVAVYTWRNPFSSGLRHEVEVRSEVVHWIRQQTPNLAEQRLLFAAWYQAETVNGTPFLGYARMKELTGLAKDSLDSAIKGLRDKRGTLVQIRNYSHSVNVESSRVRQYRLNGQPPHTSMGPPLFVITSDTWDPRLWFRLLRTLFSEDLLKREYRFSYHRILSVDPLPIGKSA